MEGMMDRRREGRKDGFQGKKGVGQGRKEGHQ
jgi:hypothetical protein